MEERPLFQGELVRLTAADIDNDAELYTAWSEDSLFHRLLSSDPVQPWSLRQSRDELKKSISGRGEYPFSIRTLLEPRLIGFASLEEVSLPNADGWIGIGIGERDFWGKGYGSDSMRILLRFAFQECNLYRVSLNVFEYNLRARGVYEHLGFREEGRIRQYLHRDGKRWDMICMGLLRTDWLAAAD